MENELATLKQRWLASKSFADEQAYLAAQVRLAGAPFVFLDPDGTFNSWLAVVVRGQTGVIYATQCAGVATEQRLVEGYLVPLGGWKYDVDNGRIELAPLTQVFHQDDACMWSWQGSALPVERLAMLTRLIEEIPFWRCRLNGLPAEAGSSAVPGPPAVAGSDSKHALHLDLARSDEIAEAWIPVETPHGPGVLLYKNCD